MSHFPSILSAIRDWGTATLNGEQVQKELYEGGPAVVWAGTDLPLAACVGALVDAWAR